MYIDKKVVSWVRDYYKDNEVTLEELIEDPDTDQGFKERLGLSEFDEYATDETGSPIIEIYSDDGKLIHTR